MQERDSAPSPEPRFFSDTLSAERGSMPLRHGLSAPIGLAAHGFALAAIALMSMLAIPEPTSPNAPSTTILQFAPPPPPTLVRGASTESVQEVRAIDANAVTFELKPSFVIPDAMLVPVLPNELSYGAESGFDDGAVNGMTGGMPGGVVGGVPGGLASGVLGGTGTELPKLPKPDVGPRALRMPQPSYTKVAIREKVRGSVKLRVVIDEQGKVEVLEILRSIPELDAAAIRTVESSWRFEPATKNGRPIPCLSDLVVRFNLY